MLPILHSATLGAPASTAPVEMSVIVTPADQLSAYLRSQIELERRAETPAARCRGIFMQLASPLAGVLMSAIVVTVLLLQHLRPGTIPPIAAWLLGWTPLVLVTAVWWASLPSLRTWWRGVLTTNLQPNVRPGAPETQLRIRLLPGEVASECASRRLHVLHHPRHTTVETPDAFTMVLDDAVVPIPKRGLDNAALASLRTVLQGWQLRDGPARASLVLPLISLILAVCGAWLWASPGASKLAARPVPGQATILLTDRLMRLDGWRTTIENEVYQVWMVDGQMYDQLRGTLKHRTAEGRFSLGRHAPGNIARTAEAEFRLIQETNASTAPVPDDATVMALPDSGVLIIWPDRRGDGHGSCAALRSYRDRIPVEALPSGT